MAYKGLKEVLDEASHRVPRPRRPRTVAIATVSKTRPDYWSIPCILVHCRAQRLPPHPRDILEETNETARLPIVLLPVFKTDGAPRKRALGGFDSRASAGLARLQVMRPGRRSPLEGRSARRAPSPRRPSPSTTIRFPIGSFPCGPLQVDGGAAAPPST